MAKKVKIEKPDANTVEHNISVDNAGRFFKDLQKMLLKYNVHVGRDPLKLVTTNLDLEIRGDLKNCPPHCVLKIEHCDINGKNCWIEFKCQC